MKPILPAAPVGITDPNQGDSSAMSCPIGTGARDCGCTVTGSAPDTFGRTVDAGLRSWDWIEVAVLGAIALGGAVTAVTIDEVWPWAVAAGAAALALIRGACALHRQRTGAG